MKVGSDAERISEINELERVIASKLPARNSAVAELQETQRTETTCRNAVKEASKQITDAAKMIIEDFPAVYLNGAMLDRGALKIGREHLRFHGWHGSVDIDLQSITRFDFALSCVPSRAGIPLLEKIWPGSPRDATTLLLKVHNSRNEQDYQVVLADLLDAKAVQAAIQLQQEKHGEVIEQNADHEAQHKVATATLDMVSQDVAQAKARLGAVEADIAPYRKKRDQLIAQQREIDSERKRVANGNRSVG